LTVKEKKNMEHRTQGWIAAFCLLPILLSGCSQRTINSANSDAQHDVTAISHAADKAAQEAKPQIKKLELGTRVSTALTAADLHGIHVEANPGGVSLVGHVKNASDKKRALQIAKDTLGPQKTVTDRLTVAQ
jgi:osmotically-inducible protein OsmY